MTVRAAWCVREVVLALRVAAQASRALGSRGRFTVPGVAALAILMLGFGM